MIEQRHVKREYKRKGVVVIIKPGKNSNLVKSRHGSVIKNNASLLTTYTADPDFSPGEKKLSSIGFKITTKVLFHTPALDWINAGYDLTTLDKEINDTRIQIGNNVYNLSQIKPEGYLKGSFLYVLIGCE